MMELGCSGPPCMRTASSQSPLHADLLWNVLKNPLVLCRLHGMGTRGQQVQRSASLPGCPASTTSSWQWQKEKHAGVQQRCPACTPTSCCACSPPSLPASTSPSAAASPQPRPRVRPESISPCLFNRISNVLDCSDQSCASNCPSCIA